MREPNFSELQLQQAANTAFVQRVYEDSGYRVFAHIPSLVSEFDLGWDTGFHLRWLRHPPSMDDEGCNFFLQYKLSLELTSSGARERVHWGAEYLRFKIPHSTRDSSGKFVDDYHQWERLKALAERNYPTFYATNSTLSKAELQSLMEVGMLLDYVPLLDIRTVGKLHKYVTFTKTSNAFAMHSEKEEVRKNTFSEVLGQLARAQPLPLSVSSKRIISTLEEMKENDESWTRDLMRIRHPVGGFFGQSQEWIEYSRLISFVQKHFGANLFWLPRGR